MTTISMTVASTTLSMTASEAKLEIIRKLLAKAERAATPAEADAYNEKAAELMARHGVDAAVLPRPASPPTT